MKVSYTLQFKKFRRNRRGNGDVMMHQLLARMEKLLYNGPNMGLLGKAGVKQRKEFEKSVVEWVDETMVPLCPGCGGVFGLFRRRHHCRLCGAVLCGPCSLGLNVNQCIKLSAPVNTDQPQPSGSSGSGSSGSGSSDGAVKMRKPTVGDEMLRVCHDCHRTLIVAFNIKAEQAKLRSKKTPTHPSLKLHKVISSAIRNLLPPVQDDIIDEDDGGAGQSWGSKSASPLLPAYCTLAYALNEKEQLSRYKEGVQKHAHIMRLFSDIDKSSKVLIAILKDQKPTADICRVHQRIRMRVTEFLSIHMVTLPKLPESRVVDAWKTEQAATARKMQQERPAAAAQKGARGGSALLPFMVAEREAAAAAAAVAGASEEEKAPRFGRGISSLSGNGSDARAGTPEIERKRMPFPSHSDSGSGSGRDTSVRRNGGNTGSAVASRGPVSAVQRRQNNAAGRDRSANPRPTSNFLATKVGAVPTPAHLQDEARRKIRTYIKKAQMAGNLEEVESLQQQLMELS